VNDNIPVIQAPRTNLTESLFSSSGRAISISKGSDVAFMVKENPAPEAQPDTISVNAYTLSGQPVKVLSQYLRTKGILLEMTCQVASTY